MDSRYISVFLDNFSTSTKFHTFTTVNKSRQCKPPSLLEVEYYKDNDITLGSYLMRLALRADEPCENF